jgi:hypothetical protein
MAIIHPERTAFQKGVKMLRKIIGTILIVLGGPGIVVLIFGGGPILPHIIGPVVLVVAGIFVLTRKRKAKKFIQEQK